MKLIRHRIEASSSIINSENLNPHMNFDQHELPEELTHEKIKSLLSLKFSPRDRNTRSFIDQGEEYQGDREKDE